MKLDDYFAKTPQEAETRYYGCHRRTYYCEEQILHPVTGHIARKGSGELVQIHVGSATDDPRRMRHRYIAAKDLRPGDVIECRWPPSEDHKRFAYLGDWDYSPLAKQQIDNRSYVDYPSL